MAGNENYSESVDLVFLADHTWPLPIQVSFNPECVNGERGKDFSLPDGDLMRFRSRSRVVSTSRGSYVRTMDESGGIPGSHLSSMKDLIPDHLEYLGHIVGDFPVPVLRVSYVRKDNFMRDEPDRPPMPL